VPRQPGRLAQGPTAATTDSLQALGRTVMFGQDAKSSSAALFVDTCTSGSPARLGTLLELELHGTAFPVHWPKWLHQR